MVGTIFGYLLDLINGLSLAQGPAFLGLSFITLMWNADTLVKPESRAAFGASARSFWSYELQRFEFFRVVYDRLFRTQAFLRPALLRFVIVAPLTVMVVGAFLFLQSPGLDQVLQTGDFQSTLTTLGLIFGTFFGISNVLFDYLSVWLSRSLIALLGRSMWIAPVVLVADFLGSAALWVVGWVAVFIVAGMAFNHVSFNSAIESAQSSILGENALLSKSREALAFYLHPHASGAATTRDNIFSYWLVGTSLISTIMTSVWLWLYTLSLLVSGLLRAILAPLRPLLKHVDFESVPLRINGLIGGALLTGGGVALSQFGHLIHAG